MEELPSSGNTDSIESAMSSLRRERDDLQHDMQQDMRFIMGEMGKLNSRFAAQLQHHYQSKISVTLAAVDKNLGHLLETRKDIETTRRRIQAFSASSAQISSDSPAAAASGGPRLHRITPHTVREVREGREGESGILADVAAAGSAGSAATNVQDQVDIRGVMPVKSVNAAVDGSLSDEGIGAAACKLEYDAAGNANLGLGQGFMAVEGAKRGSATRKRAKQGGEDQQQQAQGGKAQKQKAGAAAPTPVAESVDTK